MKDKRYIRYFKLLGLIGLLAVCGLLLTAPGRAEGGEAAEPGSAVPAIVKDIPGGRLRQVRLSSGVNAVIQYVPESPAALIGLTVKAGSKFDEAKWGRSHLLEHMLFRRTAKYSGGRLGVSLEDAGARRGARTDRDSIRFWEVVPPEAVNLALDIEADRLSGLVFVNKELENERSLIVKELRELDGRPLRRINVFFLRGLFPELNGGGLIPDGSAESLAGISGSDLLGFYRERFLPENAALTLISSMPFAAAEKILEDRFGQRLLKDRQAWLKSFRLPEAAKDKNAAAGPSGVSAAENGAPAAAGGAEGLDALLRKEGCAVYAAAWPVSNEGASDLAVRMVLDSFLTDGRMSYVSELLHKHSLEAKVRIIRDDDPIDSLYCIALQPSEGIEPGELAAVMGELYRDRNLAVLDESKLLYAREKAAADFYRRWQDYPERLELLNLASLDGFRSGWEDLPSLIKRVSSEDVRSLWRSLTAEPPKSYASPAGTSFKAMKSGISARSVFAEPEREASEDENAGRDGAAAAAESGADAEKVYVPDPDEAESGASSVKADDAGATPAEAGADVPEPEAAIVPVTENAEAEEGSVLNSEESEAEAARKGSADGENTVGGAEDILKAQGKDKIHYLTLANGVRAALWEDKALPVIALHGFLAGGNRLDPEGKPGLSKTASRLLGTSTSRRSAKENAAFAEENAFSLSFMPQDDGVIIKGWCLRERLPEFLELLNDYLSASQPRRSDIDNMYIKRDMSLKSFSLADRSRAYAALTAQIFPHHAWARRLETGGEEQKRTDEELTEQLAVILQPEYLTLSFAGSTDAEELQRLCGKKLTSFGSVRTAKADAEAFSLRNAQRIKKSKSYLRGESEQSIILAGQYGPAPGDKDYAACRVLLQILGGGDSSRLAVRIVHSERLGSAAYTVCVPSAGASLWFGAMQVSPDKADRALAVFKQELNRLADPGPNAAELKRAVSACKGSQQVRWLSPVARAEWGWLNLINRVRISDPDSFLRAYDRVTLHDIRAAAKKWFLFDDIQIVTVKAEDKKQK